VTAASYSWTQIFQDGLTGLAAVLVFIAGGWFAERLIREGRRQRSREERQEPEPEPGPKDPIL
jgi:hypothetical protein